MHTNGLAQKIRDRLAILLDVDPSEVADHTAFTDLGVDSMGRLELIALVEQHIGLELAESKLQGLISIEHVVDYVQGLDPV